MRYYFHLEKGENLHLDHRGREFSKPDDVRVHAVAMAREFSERKRGWDGWSILVVDAHNTEVLRLPLVDAVSARKEGATAGRGRPGGSG